MEIAEKEIAEKKPWLRDYFNITLSIFLRNQNYSEKGLINLANQRNRDLTYRLR
jgi:hypothetical protein